MTLHQKVIVFQWFLGFVGAWAIVASISSMKIDAKEVNKPVEASIVEVVPIIQTPLELKELKPLPQK